MQEPAKHPLVNLQKLREAKGLSLEKLSEQFNPKIARATISRWEQGYGATVDKAAILAKFFGVSIGYLTANRELGTKDKEIF